MDEKEFIEISNSFCEELNDHIGNFMKNKLKALLEDKKENPFEYFCLFVTLFLKTLTVKLTVDLHIYNKTFPGIFPSKEDVCEQIMRGDL